MKKFLIAIVVCVLSFTAQAEPSLYTCQNSDRFMVYIVISDALDFMVFNDGGRWVNRGTFDRSITDDGVPHFFARVGDASLIITKNNNVWQLTIIKSDGESTKLVCK